MAAKKPSSSKRSLKRPAQRSARKAARAKRPTDPGAAFCDAVESALKRGEPQAISDAALRRVLTAAVRVYAAKAEDAGREIAPFLDNAVTATETVTAACAMIRAADLNLFDVAMWFRRPVAGEE
jgi:nitrite reductase (NADH) small subunit